MDNIIFIFLMLAIYHFIVETFIIPTLRFKMYCKLMKRRDELFAYRIEHAERINQKIFQELNMLLCITANNLDHLSLLNMIMSKSKPTSEHAEKTINLLSHISDFKLRNTYRKVSKYGFLACLINSAGWFIYLLPFLLLGTIIIILISAIQHVNIILNFYIREKKRVLIIISQENKCSDETVIVNYSFDKKRHKDLHPV
jgi:hypothetical protein